jgi:hypothetical protein
MVFDAMPHAFWYRFDLPESKEALEAQANFLDRHLAEDPIELRLSCAAPLRSKLSFQYFENALDGCDVFP